MVDDAAPSGSGRPLKVTRITFEVLELVVDRGEVGVTELAEHLDLPKSTAHTYLDSLVRCGYLRNEGGRYRASYRLLEMGGRVRHDTPVFQAARTEIDALADRTGEVVNLGVEEDARRVLLYEAEGENAIWDNSPIGGHEHLHMTAIGKSILAHHPPEFVDGVVEEHGLPAATERTITDRDALRADLEATRERGYAIEDEEHRAGIWAIGMPIRRRNEPPVGAVSIVGPESRISDDDHRETFVEALTETVNVIQLQYEHY